MNAGKINKAQTEIQRLFHLLFDFLAQAIPFVDYDNE
ncbi:Uncharacterised protein [Salmonella enterica subsp. enterica serovar Bovismorbificans]|uniref:Uncharacterized protein n=1 Tax=Salmonella enterica subsp. enterica serovar Bovismorbificans TaxID=58097 RepID=A0A655EFN5_SALET|nr:Uncharacterised protein [Salmonella enterica subsp. enterica serovar Bovismorbificans]CNV20083.1 Uncharacterised protein [Salmonella enterica subsp. enterica serovar Bovismorbificans]